jgi:TolA-binding protein
MIGLLLIGALALYQGKKRSKPKQPIAKLRNAAESAVAEVETRIRELRKRARKLRGEAKERLEKQASELDERRKDLEEKAESLAADVTGLLERDGEPDESEQ